MDIHEMKTLIKAMVKNEMPITPLAWGETGIGKSAGVEQAAKELGYNLLDIRLSQVDSVDIRGMPYVSKYKYTDADGTVLTDSDDSALGYHKPEWFKDVFFKENTIVFLDEINRARPDVLQAIFEFCYDRSIGQEKIPDSVFIIAAANPPTENYDVNSFGNALTNRFVHWHIKCNPDQFLEWAEDTSKFNENVLKYLKTNKDQVSSSIGQDFKLPIFDDDKFPFSPRSWDRVSQFEDNFEKDSYSRLRESND